MLQHFHADYRESFSPCQFLVPLFISFHPLCHPFHRYVYPPYPNHRLSAIYRSIPRRMGPTKQSHKRTGALQTSMTEKKFEANLATCQKFTTEPGECPYWELQHTELRLLYLPTTHTIQPSILLCHVSAHPFWETEHVPDYVVSRLHFDQPMILLGATGIIWLLCEYGCGGSPPKEARIMEFAARVWAFRRCIEAGWNTGRMETRRAYSTCRLLCGMWFRSSVMGQVLFSWIPPLLSRASKSGC